MADPRRELVHELRSPLNSILVLARILADNPRGNLDPEQVEFARTIHTAGTRLLAVIEDMLAHWKLEPSTPSAERAPAFRPTASQPHPPIHAPELAGASVLVVAADIRTIFEVTGALERHHARVAFAESAAAAAAQLDGVDVIVAEPGVVLPDTAPPIVTLTDPIDLAALVTSVRKALAR